MRKLAAAVVIATFVVAACSGDDDSKGSSATDASSAPPETVAPETAAPTTTAPAAVDEWLAGAASNSIVPTVDGNRSYLDEAPGWTDIDPDDVGVFVPAFDVGRVDVGNGDSDAAWVHDDLRATAVALQKDDQIVVMANADVYMIFAADAAEIERRARALLPTDIADLTEIVISATHNHHGPDTAFSINDDFYESMADQMADAIARAVTSLQPARLEVVSGNHRFGQSDGRDPVIVDPRLNVLHIVAVGDDSTIATVVQWASHPETTLGWEPPGDYSEQCAAKGWAADDCSADGRYLTADYPGVLREQVAAAVGGEVLYLNGAIGSQIGPGDADVWQIDSDHPIGDGVTAPAGALPVDGGTDLRSENMARTLAIGSALATAVVELLPDAQPLDADELVWNEQPFYTRLTNIGFRVLLADGDLGWQTPSAFNCDAKPFTDDNCVDDGGVLEDDVLLTPLVGSQIRKGDVLKTQVSYLGIGEVGFLFMPGELPPELVIGLPDDFTTNVEAYYFQPDEHATGADYAIPGALLDLVPSTITFTVGLGGDELGYWVPINEARLKCLDLALPPDSGWTCQRLFDEGYLITPDAVAGPVCRQLWDDPAAVADNGQVAALTAVCRYGQALGRELGEPAGHYEETNSAGWDLVDDLWTAAQVLFA